MQAKIITAQFYAEHILTSVPGLAHTVCTGGESACALPLDGLLETLKAIASSACSYLSFRHFSLKKHIYNKRKKLSLFRL